MTCHSAMQEAAAQVAAFLSAGVSQRDAVLWQAWEIHLDFWFTLGAMGIGNICQGFPWLPL